MTFRPDGFLLIFEVLVLAGHGKIGADAGPFPLTRGATKFFGPQWFDSLNHESDKYGGVSILIEQDGSVSYILETVLSRWACQQLLDTYHLPLYFCGPRGEVMRTLSGVTCLHPYARQEFWATFDPKTADLDSFVDAFMGINEESREYLYATSVVKPLKKRPKYSKPSISISETLVFDEEILHFVGWSVCVREVDWIYDADMVIQKAAAALHAGSPPTLMDVSPRRAGRPSERAQVLANVREAFPDGISGVSVSEVARRVGYDRKTTRNVLLSEGMIADRKDGGRE